MERSTSTSISRSEMKNRYSEALHENRKKSGFIVAKVRMAAVGHHDKTESLNVMSGRYLCILFKS